MLVSKTDLGKSMIKEIKEYEDRGISSMLHMQKENY